MELQTYLDHVNQGKRLEGGSEVHAFMTQAARRAQQITAEINTGYHDGEELRALFSQLIGKPVDEGFGLFPPLPRTLARTSPWASGCSSTPAAASRTRGASPSGMTFSWVTTWCWPP